MMRRYGLYIIEWMGLIVLLVGHNHVDSWHIFHIMKLLRVFCIVSVGMLLCSCFSQNDEVVFCDAEYGVEIPLTNPIEDIPFPTSIAVINDSLMVLATEKQVYIYNNGVQSIKVGYKGNAQYEYVMPMIVRSYNDMIYVWCAMTLKFLVYDTYGVLKDVYHYGEAVADFRVADSKIFIYNTGRNDKYMVSVYDMAERKATPVPVLSSAEHKKLILMHSLGPLCVGDDVLTFASKDGNGVYSYNIADGSISIGEQFESSSFHVERAGDSDDNWDYIKRNPYLLVLDKSGTDTVILTSEGFYDEENGHTNTANRFYSLYLLNEKVCRYVGSFRHTSLGDPALFSVYENQLYFITHHVSDDSDCYLLRAMDLYRTE